MALAYILLYVEYYITQCVHYFLDLDRRERNEIYHLKTKEIHHNNQYFVYV